MLNLGVFTFKSGNEEITIDTQIIPSEENVLSTVLQGAIDGNVPKQSYIFPEGCIYDWKFKGQAYQGCAPLKEMGGGRLACPTQLDSEGNWFNNKVFRKYFKICGREVTPGISRLYTLYKQFFDQGLFQVFRGKLFTKVCFQSKSNTFTSNMFFLFLSGGFCSNSNLFPHGKSILEHLEQL